MLRLLLADDDDVFRQELAACLTAQYEVQQCRDGKSALREILLNPPDVLVVNLIMPGLDGITMLHRVLDRNIYPMVLALTPIVTDYVLSVAEEVHVAYVMLKPCAAADVADRVQHITRRLCKPELDESSPRFQISRQLQALGFNPKHRGWGLLQTAIEMETLTPGRSVTKEVYPTLAEQAGISTAQAEHAIRCAIAYAWEHSTREVWKAYLTPDALGEYRRPTNSTFITSLAEETRWILKDRKKRS